jgi:hypothetical protein
LVARFEPYIIAEFDNVDLAKATIRKLAVLSEAAPGDPQTPAERMDMLEDFFNEEGIINARARQVPLSAFAIGTINGVFRAPTCLLRPQLFDDIKLFFDPDFVVPRSLPFRQKDPVRVALVGDRLLLANRDNSVVFPMFILSIKEPSDQSQPAGYSVVTPVGFFVMEFPQSVSLVMLQLGITFAQFMEDRCQSGMRALQTAKTRLFQCLCAYQPAGEKTVKLRFLIVRAGQEEECYDIGHATVMEGRAMPPLFFNARARDLTDGSLMFIQSAPVDS